MKRGWMQGMRLTLFFTVVVASIFMITSIIMVAMGFAAMHLGLAESLGLKKTFPIVLAVLPASAIVGTLVALFFGRIPLKPVRAIVNATNQLAAGDFSARISLGHPPFFRDVSESFNRMAQELSSIEMLRTDFVNNFSHEFKTPIVSIKGFAELLKADDLPQEERNAYLDIIIRESTRLAAMATNVLNLSRVENQNIVADRREYNLGEQIRRCILMMENSWEKKNLQLEIDLEDTAILDNEEMLQQVWVNLLDNAIKFSRENGHITVSLAAVERQAIFTLRDDGVGVEPKDLPHIFDKFYQSDTTRTLPGNGLGLALVSKIVKLHGGDVDCTSKPDEGTVFTVRLPLRGHAVS